MSASSTSKTTTPGSTTVKVSTNTGAAKDDLFRGITEDSGATNLNVLANDPGSAKIWSLDQNALKALASSQQPQQLAAYTLASGARISLNIDGTVRYEGAATLQRMAEGEIFNDSFTYTIRMANGALSTATATVAITGVNDAATFAGEKSGTLTEDAAATSGRLLVSDVDHDQSAMQASAQSGSFGTLAIDTAGAWNYQRSSDMNYLQQGETVSESFTVRSLDGTAQTIDVTISGVNDVAVFGGVAGGNVQEDGALCTGGVLTVSDLDHDQGAFAATGNLAGTYGDFSFDLGTGAWNYVLRNADTNVQALATGQNVQDKLQITSVDGTTSELVVTIGGQDEVIVVPPAVENPADKWVVNKQNVTKNGGGLHIGFENDVAVITGFDSNDTIHYTSLDKEDPFVQVVDTNNDGKLDTVLNFSYEQGGSVEHVDVVLLGYTGFSADQLFLG